MSTYGTVERSGDVVRLRYERHLGHPVETVWRALTEPSELGAWFGGKVEADLRVGGDYVTHHHTGDRVVDTIVRLDPPRLLEHTFWKHVNPDALVTYELEPTDGGCRLVLTHSLSAADLRRAAESYNWAGDPLDQLKNTAAGWHRLLDGLEAALDGTPQPAPMPADVEALRADYAERLNA